METSWSLSMLSGFGTGAGLIIAIGAQNAFVLKQGLLRNRVFVTALFCALLDAFLIGIGVGGFGSALASNPFLLTCAKWGGALFLIYYGAKSFYAVFSSHTLDVHAPQRNPSLKSTLLTLSALSLLNPHVYLDTVVLLGSISAQFQKEERIFFGVGAAFASLVWFFSLCYGARFLAPLFRKPISWKILDFLIGCVMIAIALSLLFYT